MEEQSWMGKLIDSKLVAVFFGSVLVFGIVAAGFGVVVLIASLFLTAIGQMELY